MTASGKSKPFGVASLMVGETGICLCWLPHVGWLGVLLGFVGNGLAVAAITEHHGKIANTSYGISGIVTSTLAATVGLAFQTKHLAGKLDWILAPFSTTTAYAALIVMSALFIFGLFIARTRAFRAGNLLAAFALVAVVVFGSTALVKADRDLVSDRAEP